MNETEPAEVLPAKHYFVDEAGDGTLFNGRGHVIIGQEGCSRYFMLGVLDVANPPELDERLRALRARLLADPYFRGVPSMLPEARKTALAFHATDDVAEVRREVLSRRLFRDLLHRGASHDVCFATRGKSDRTEALRSALEAARRRFEEKWSRTNDAPVQVWSCPSHRCGCLQATDYFLWALQRLFERGEERYVSVLWPRFRLVVDVDDRRVSGAGVYYTQKRPLSAAALGERGEGI